MKFDFDHPAPEPSGAMSPKRYWAFCLESIRRNSLVRPETCMATDDDERWMDAPFTLYPQKTARPTLDTDADL